MSAVQPTDAIDHQFTMKFICISSQSQLLAKLSQSTKNKQTTVGRNLIKVLGSQEAGSIDDSSELGLGEEEV